MGVSYWLVKSEPEEYSIDDLKRARVGRWEGVRNYAARNYLREMRKGDSVLFYHSSTDIIGVFGVATVVQEAYTDPTQFKKGHAYYDSKSKHDVPHWDSIDVRFKQKFKTPVTLAVLKQDPFFHDLLVTKKGIRLSVMPVEERHFERIVGIGNT